MKSYLSLLILLTFISLPSISTAQNSDTHVSPSKDLIANFDLKKPILRLSYRIGDQRFLYLDGQLATPPQKTKASETSREQGCFDTDVKIAVNKLHPKADNKGGCDSPIKGGSGNHEYLLHAVKTGL